MANNLGLDPFPDPVGHFGAPWRPFWILQAVRRCRRWASAPGAARLVFLCFFNGTGNTLHGKIHCCQPNPQGPWVSLNNSFVSIVIKNRSITRIVFFNLSKIIFYAKSNYGNRDKLWELINSFLYRVFTCLCISKLFLVTLSTLRSFCKIAQ